MFSEIPSADCCDYMTGIFFPVSVTELRIFNILAW